MSFPPMPGSPASTGRWRRRLLLGTLMGATLSAARAATGAAPETEEPPVIERLVQDRAEIEVQFAPGFDDRFRFDARTWVRRSAAAVSAYFGRFPVARVELLLLPEDGAGVRGGTTFGVPSLLVRVRVGRSTTAQDFLDDWVLVHEMIHLAVPRVPRAQSWLQEGIATYVGSVVRGTDRLVPATTVWLAWRTAMPQGLPGPGDAGLDHTPTWGRTYWGGAIFCLLADVRLLTQTAGRAGLRQALQGVLAAGGSYAMQWPVERILASADASIGGTVLATLHRELKEVAPATDLDALWRDLGVAAAGLDDGAPLAWVRRAIL